MAPPSCAWVTLAHVNIMQREQQGPPTLTCRALLDDRGEGRAGAAS